MRLILQIAAGVVLGNCAYAMVSAGVSLFMLSAAVSAFTSANPSHGAHLDADQWCSGGFVVSRNAAGSVFVVKEAGASIPCTGVYRWR